MNSAIKSLILTAGQHGVELSMKRLLQENAIDEHNELETSDIVKIARKNNLKAKKIKAKWKDLTNLGNAFPVIAKLKNGHFIIVSSYQVDPENPEAETLSILNPALPNAQLEQVDKERFISGWSGELILLSSNYDLSDEKQPFSLRWMMSEFFRQKALLIQTVVIALLIHFFTVLPIIYIMIVLDKVVNFEAYSTLYVIAIGVLIGHFFSGILGYLKQYLSLFFVSKLEVKLNIRTFNNILDQPLSYFHSNLASNLIKTAQQVGTIRHFIVTKVFGTILDSTALLIYVPILIIFSPTLFVVVLFFSLCIALNNIWSSKKQKDMLRQINEYDNDKQNTLDNAVKGIETVKTLALEHTLKRNWEEYSTHHTIANMEQAKVAARSQQISSTLQQMMTVVVIFIGVLMVFNGDLSPGVLIGVNMLAGKITSPLVQLVSMSTDIEKFTMAVSSLAELINRKGETKTQGCTPNIAGAIEFQNVSFSYDGNKKVINDMSFSILPRQSVAIVGPSGAGKTTLLRLIQGLLKPDQGSINIDQLNLRTFDMEHLRNNVTMVSQNNSYFNETIRQNILHPMPTASNERFSWSIRMTCLETDMAKLADGSETKIDINGSNLPTSMLQRIALARGLIRNPRVLLLDEVLVGLSIDDEIQLLNNMTEINRGRTLIIVTHNLSQIIRCDKILVLNEEGNLIEQGQHEELLAANGFYTTLWDKERILRMMTTQGVSQA